MKKITLDDLKNKNCMLHMHANVKLFYELTKKMDSVLPDGWEKDVIFKCLDEAQSFCIICHPDDPDREYAKFSFPTRVKRSKQEGKCRLKTR